MTLTVYEKPTCTTCRKAVKIFEENGIDFQKVNYSIEPFSKDKLASLLKKMNMKPSGLLRKSEGIYKSLNIGDSNFSEEKILQLMIEHPDLIQRPIVEAGEKAILARPIEVLDEFLKSL
ncbi:MAG TPA: ArsC/Spx/MgsR family protein [Ignavibacteriales bacterium]|nr:ArsC/Spx/MgsR family protein [Ignavibacteriales bacterium]